MNSESVDLIATDPPFNKGRDFHATPDSLAAGAKFQDRWSWERDVHEEWADQITDDYPRLMEAIESARYAHSDGMGAYMCFMAVRLLEMRRVLKPTGSIYLHCDPTASHYLKAVMDAIFGWKQFRNEIVWCYSHGGKSRKHFGKKHDIILRYSKSASFTFNANAIGVAMTPHKQDASGKSYGGRMGIDDDGREYVEKQGTRNSKGQTRYYRYYLDEGKVPEDWWVDINSIQAGAKERTGYPTQKPLPLYERMIKASSNEGDIVLDPFCGCATTCVAAENLKRQWVGIDIWDKASETVVKRLQDRGLTAGGKGDKLMSFGTIHYETDLPNRSDTGENSAPFLRVKQRVKEPDGPKWTRAQMYEHLLDQNGSTCQGCDRTFDDPRYLELDHNTPRSDGGLNHISNRVLLCGPCNRLKSNIYTLAGLRRENKRRGYMKGT